MNVKIDTKEKFTVFRFKDAALSANMTGEASNLLLTYLEKDLSHLIVDMTEVKVIDEVMANKICDIQQTFYEKNHSFVVCCMQPLVEEVFEKLSLLELMNVTPTESEAWDIVQMEEIERELMGDFDDEYEG